MEAHESKPPIHEFLIDEGHLTFEQLNALPRFHSDGPVPLPDDVLADILSAKAACSMEDLVGETGKLKYLFDSQDGQDPTEWEIEVKKDGDSWVLDWCDGESEPQTLEDNIMTRCELAVLTCAV